MKYSLLILLAFAVRGFAQPLEGPFDVTEADEAIHHIQVAARNDSVADVFYQIGNDAYHAAFALDLGMMYSGPNAFPNDGWSREICDVCSNVNGWNAIVYDTTETLNRTRVSLGSDTLTSTLSVDSGYIWGGGIWSSASNNRELRIVAHEDGGFFASWVDWWSWYNGQWGEAGVGFSVFGYSIYEPGGTYHWENGFAWFSSGFVQPVYADSAIILGASAEYYSLCISGFSDLGCFGLWPHGVYDCNADPIAWIASIAGRYLVLSRSGSNYLGPFDARLVELDSIASSCNTVITLSDNPLAAASDPSFGFAWLSQPSSGLLLNRADTNGALVHPAGVVHWPEQDQRIIESNLDITDNGKIVMVWTEQPLDAETPTQLRIAAVNWSAPLSSSDADFTPHPSSFILSAYPNPFNAQTTLSFVLPQAGEVSLRVYDISGRLVRTLIQNERMTAGEHRFVFDAAGLPSGIYLCQLDLENAKIVQKVVLLR